MTQNLGMRGKKEMGQGTTEIQIEWIELKVLNFDFKMKVQNFKKRKRYGKAFGIQVGVLQIE